MRRFATNAANSYARADVRETLKKRKEKEKGKEKERGKKTKDPTQRSRTKRFVFRLYLPMYKLYIGF